MAKEDSTDLTYYTGTRPHPNIVVGVSEGGELVTLKPGNVFVHGHLGAGTATFVQSILASALMWNGPRDLRIWVANDYYAGDWLIPEWCRITDDNSIVVDYTIEEKSGGYEDIINSIDRFYEKAVIWRTNLRNRVKLEGDANLSQHESDMLNAECVLMVNMFNLHTSAERSIFNSLMKVFKAQEEDTSIRVIIVGQDWSWSPDIVFKYFSTLICTPCKEEYSKLLLRNNCASSTKYKAGCIWIRQVGDIECRFAQVVYRPDTFLRKLIKAFHIKGKK